MFRFLVPLLLLWGGPVMAGGTNADAEIAEAEQVRLLEEMGRLVQRQAWSGVERYYQELIGLGVTIDAESYVQGAHAARGLGDMQACYDRLREAARTSSDRSIIDWLWAIDSNYGTVKLEAEVGSTLAVEVWPIDTEQRKAVQRAITVVAEQGGFTGMLPVGDYTVNTHVLTVRAGSPVELIADR